jgi:hypothetical protein
MCRPGTVRYAPPETPCCSTAPITTPRTRTSAARQRGVRRGDRLLLVLGNVVPLWEVMLRAIRLDAVIIPASQRQDQAGRAAAGRGEPY